METSLNEFLEQGRRPKVAPWQCRDYYAQQHWKHGSAVFVGIVVALEVMVELMADREA